MNASILKQEACDWKLGGRVSSYGADVPSAAVLGQLVVENKPMGAVTTVRYSEAVAGKRWLVVTVAEGRKLEAVTRTRRKGR